jgi:HPt (histidine-containing phosphotransfer) domain-containing protein
MLINLDNLKALSRHNEGFIREILEVYLTNTPKDLEQMKDAVSEENWQVVRYYAHKLKSSSFTIGFQEGYKQFQAIESTIKNEESTDDMSERFNAANAICDDCIREVKIELSKYI